MRRLLDRWLGAGLALVVALMLVNAGVDYRNTRRLHDDAYWVAHTREVLDGLDDLLSTMKDAEAGQRGFLITGDERDLQPYVDARAAVDGKIERIKRLTADDARQQARIPRLRELVRANLGELTRTVALRKEPGFAAAQKAVLTHLGMARMDSLRAFVAEMHADERRLLRDRQEANDRAYLTAQVTSFGGALVGLVAVLAFIWALRGELQARNKAAALLHDQQRSLREADRRKDEFIAILAHELRNPLAPIRNAVELLRLSAGGAALVEQARSMMERQVAQMTRLVDDLLDVSRIASGKLQLRKERVPLAAVVQSAVEAQRPLLAASAHELTVTLPSEPIDLEADPARLAQIISNLLNNAAKYTERGGHIWLTGERQGDDVVISVRDNGIGIAAEHLPHIFDMFAQAEPALERSQGGLGIGLPLVKGLVERHGGSIAAESDGLGKGCRFTVRLPA